MTTATLTAVLDLTLNDDEINELWDENQVDVDDVNDEFYQECLNAEFLESLEMDLTFVEFCYWRLHNVQDVAIDDSHIICGGEETLVSVYDTLDGFYLALIKIDGSQEVKFFPYEISALEAATLVFHYGGCPVDKENYLEAVQYDLGISYTPESWDAK